MKVNEIIKTDVKLSQSKQVILNLMITSQWVANMVSETLKDFDISSPQFNVLRILRGQKGVPANLSTVQDRMVNKMSNTTRIIDKLIQKGYVDRKVCPENRRKIEITITQEGMELLNKIDPIVEETEKEVTKNLTNSELKTISEFLEKLRK